MNQDDILSVTEQAAVSVYAIKFSNGWQYTASEESAYLARQQDLQVVTYVPHDDLRGAVARITELEDALRNHGVHAETCPRFALYPDCTCGLDDLLGGQ
jgi:hypothetical protein